MSRITIRAGLLLFLSLGLMLAAQFYATTRPPQETPSIALTGKLSADKVRRGRSVQATLIMDIPSGYHVNSSRPLEKFLVPTQLKIDAPQGIRVSAVSYPRAILRTFKFSRNKVSVYEGRATMRVNVIVPANFTSGSAELKARLRYQSCNEEACFPPQTREVSLWLTIE
jgi:DsbC/DsbD-like thiol-disulfide interchange protein